MRARYLYILLFVLVVQTISVAASDTIPLMPETTDTLPAKRPNKALCAFYRFSEKVDRYLMQGIDTDYIALPEHSWRLALNTSMVGINSHYVVDNITTETTMSLLSKTTPSVDLGFQAGYRGFGFGYSWDLLHAYANKLSFSLGSKRMGLEYSRQVSTNLDLALLYKDATLDKPISTDIGRGYLWVTNTNLSAWYALNSAHYSHNAAVKQSYIQRRSAGSLLLQLAYTSTEMAVADTLTYQGKPILSFLIDDVKKLQTHQVSVGIGYGINYTPNHGKLLLHLAGFAQLVCYSINHVSYAVPDSITLPGEPYFKITPSSPVHVTGTVRAAVSWEINPWLHLSAHAQANHVHFDSKTYKVNTMIMNNWNWQVHLSLGVRFGAGRERVRQTLDAAAQYYPAKSEPIMDTRYVRRHNLPRWFTDYFYSPAQR